MPFVSRIAKKQDSPTKLPGTKGLIQGATDGTLWGLAAVLVLTRQGSAHALGGVCERALELANLDIHTRIGVMSKQM